MQNTQPEIVVSEADAEKLDALLEQVSVKDFPGKANLTEELDRANIVPSSQIPADVVTMNSKVRFKDVSGGQSFTRTLVYPKQAGQEETISILAPIGSALLGLSVGQEISWPKPGGGLMQVQIEEIVYQPERDGAMR